MPITTKHKKISRKERASSIVDNKVGNYEKHPFFIKKANEAKAFFKEVGLPKKLINPK